MNRLVLSILTWWSFLSMGMPCQVLFADDSLKENGTTIVRTQLQQIAEEVVEKAQLNPQKYVFLHVTGEGPTVLAENALLSVLQARKMRCSIGKSEKTEQSLSLVLLGVHLSTRELSSKQFERTVTTKLEARVSDVQDVGIKYLGTFMRTGKDTTKVYSSGIPWSEEKDEEEGFVQRMMTPLILISSALVIVYLFFTVRS